MSRPLTAAIGTQYQCLTAAGRRLLIRFFHPQRCPSRLFGHGESRLEVFLLQTELETIAIRLKPNGFWQRVRRVLYTDAADRRHIVEHAGRQSGSNRRIADDQGSRHTEDGSRITGTRGGRNTTKKRLYDGEQLHRRDDEYYKCRRHRRGD